MIHQSPDISHIILITTTLAWVIILDPVRVYAQNFIERRFNVRDRQVVEAIEAFTSTLREEIDLDQLRERFLNIIQRTIQPYSVSLWMRAAHEQQAKSGSVEAITVADDDPLITYVLHYPGSLGIDRLQLDSPVLRDLKLRGTEMILPLANQGELIGLLILGPNLSGEEYAHKQQAILDALAPQVAPALHVANMVQEQQEQVRERERVEQELRTAQSIQQAFLPKEAPALPGWQLIPYYQPAREVGGDFYDFLLLDDGQLSLVIGDVAGKGVPSALLMGTVHTMLRAAVQGMTSPGEVLARVNDLLAAEIPTGMFVTCFFLLLDPTNGRLRYSNAGHEPPYRRHNGNTVELWAAGMPLGMLPGSKYEEHEAHLAPGESLLFYSDGLVEAHDPAHEMFGFPRLQALLEEQSAAASLIDTLLGELKRFTGEGWEQEDDVTLMLLQRAPAASLNLDGT